MIHYIKGKLAIKSDGLIVVETGGIGYEIYVAGNSRFFLATEGDDVTVFTTMIVREDDVSVYGFASEEERELFAKLRTVNGVGAKAALSVLSAMPLHQLKIAIVYEDAKTITKANGIGKKTADRIVLELKDKLGSVEAEPGDDSDALGITNEALNEFENAAGNDERGEAVSALMALGYSKNEAYGAVGKVKGEDIPVEDIIRQALKQL